MSDTRIFPFAWAWFDAETQARLILTFCALSFVASNIPKSAPAPVWAPLGSLRGRLMRVGLMDLGVK